MSIQRYLELREKYPALFVNPPGCPYRIIYDVDVITRESARLKQDIGVLAEDDYVVFLRDLVVNPLVAASLPFGYDRTISKTALSGKPLVAVLPVRASKILLLRIFRHATRSFHWEIPRGFGELEQSSIITAKTELESEMGIQADECIELGGVHSDSGITANYLKVFYAKVNNLAKASPQYEEGILEVKAVPVDKVEEMIRDGKITDAVTISAILLARARSLV